MMMIVYFFLSGAKILEKEGISILARI